MVDYNQLKDVIRENIKKNRKYRFLNINPGFNKKFGHIGHHLNQNLLLKNKVIEDGGDFFVLCSHDLDYDDKFRNLPTFTYTPWKLLKEGDSEEFHRSFKNEFLETAAVINELDPKTHNIFFMYMADIRMIPTFIDISFKLNSKKLKNFFIINLFHAYNDFFPNGLPNDDINEASVTLLKISRELRKKSGISLLVETGAIQQAIFNYTGEKLNLLPQFSSTLANWENEPGKYLSGDQKSNKEKLSIFYPTATLDRGLSLVLELIEVLRKKRKINQFKFVIRLQRIDCSNDLSILEMVKNHVEVRRGAFTNDEYIEYITNSDAVLLPYRAKNFFARSSGIYSDAIYALKPVIATKQTWTGEKIDEFSNGVTFNDNKIEEFYDAIFKLKDNYHEYLDHCVKTWKIWKKHNNTASFIKIVKRELRAMNPKKRLRFDATKNETEILNLLNLLQDKNCRLNRHTRELARISKKNDQRYQEINKSKKLVIDKNNIISKKNEKIKELRESNEDKLLLLRKKTTENEKLVKLNLEKNESIKEKNKRIMVLEKIIAETENRLKSVENECAKLRRMNSDKDRILSQQSISPHEFKKAPGEKTPINKELKEKTNEP